MKEQRKVLNIGLMIAGAIGLVGLILGTFLDQQITSAMGNFDSVFGILFTMLTPVLSLAVGSMASAMLFFMPKIEHKFWNIGLRVLAVVAFIGFTFFSIKEGKEYVNFPIMQPEKTTYVVLAITLVATIDLAIILFSKVLMKHVDTKRIIPTVLIIFLIIVAWVFVSEVIKHLASRPRPRIVMDESLAIPFRNWYEFRPFQCLKEPYKDCKSFVSGHAFIAACTIGALPLLLSLGKNSSIKKTIIGLSVGTAFTIIVCFSRIVAYAHYMSDVFGGLFAACAAQLVILNVAYKIHEKHQ